MRAGSFKSMRWVIVVSLFLLGILIGYTLALLLSKATNYIPLVSLAISSAIAIGIPIWREYFVTKSKLSVEINSIERTVVDRVPIDLREYEVLSRLFTALYNLPTTPTRIIASSPVARSSRGITKPRDPEILEGIEELDHLFENLKKKFDGLPQTIEQAKKYLADLNDIEPESFSARVAKDFIPAIPPSVMPPAQFSYFNSEEFREPDQRKEKYDELKKMLEKKIDQLEERQRQLQSPSFNMQDARETVNKIKKDLVDNRSKFSISISLVNSGRLNTSIKVPAMLRVYIARGTYANLELTLRDPENRSEVPANSTRVVVFESREISQLPEDGRNLINEYWKKMFIAHSS